MSRVKRVALALLVAVYTFTSLPLSVAFAAEEISSASERENLLDSIELIGEERSVIAAGYTEQLDPSMQIAEEGEDEVSAAVVADAEFLLREAMAKAEDEIYTDLTIGSDATTESEAAREIIREENDEEDAVEEVEEEELDEEVELEGLFNCDGNHYETKADNVTYYNKAKKGRTAKGKIAKKNTIVKVVDTGYAGVAFVSDKYYKLSNSYWVLAKNLKKHECVGGTTKTTITYGTRSGDNKYHNVLTSVTAQRCKYKDCNCVVKDAKESSKKEKHSNWHGTGYCGVCGYKFVIKEDKMSKADYMIQEDLYLRTEPYDAAPKKGGLLKKGTVIALNKDTKNAHGNTWYKSTSGGWVWSGNVTKHSHSYSSSTGKCACGKMFDYEVTSRSSTAYEVKGGDVSAKQDPYKNSPSKKTYSAGGVFYVNASTWSEPNPGWFDKGDKWFRTTDGYWIKSETVKEHTKKEHKYTASSAGKCTYRDCTGEYELTLSWMDERNHKAVAYETKGTNKVARVKPYSNTTSKHTYPYKYQIVMVSQYVLKNANGEKWFKTTNGYWIKASDVQQHTHRWVAGECSSVDCGEVRNMGLKTTTTAFYETIANNVPVKDKPFEDATTNRTLGKTFGVKVNGYTTKLTETWYRTTDNKYIQATCVKPHEHKYVNGYCSVCCQYAAYTTQSINSKIVETSKAGVTIFEKPYDKSKVKRTIAGKNEKIVIVEQATNYYKNVWYRVASGGWVYSGNIKQPSKGSISTSSKATVQSYVITVTNNKNKPITDAYIEWLGEKYMANENGNIELVYVTDKTEFTVCAPKYDSVKKTAYKMNENRRDSIVLSVAGSYEAKNVNMTYVDETTDLLKSERSINHYHTQGFFNEELITIKCVMGNTSDIGSYELAQGNKVIATSKNGEFKNLTVKSFAPKKTVLLRVYDAAGKERAEQKLLLNVFNEGPGKVGEELNLGGTSVGFTIDENFPLLGGLSVNFDLPKGIPFGVDIGDESTKYALNFQAPTSKGGDKETFKSEYKEFWDDVKELTTTNWKKLYNKKAIDKISDKGAWSGKVRVGGYAEKIHGQSTIKGKIFVEGSLKMENYFQTALGPVPVIFEIEVEGKITPSGKFVITNFKDISDVKLVLDMAASVEGSVGIGLKYVASVSAYGKATLKVEGELFPDPALDNIYMYGTFGAKVKILDMEIANWQVFETPTLYIVQNGKWVLWEEGILLEDVIADESNYAAIDRGYLENRSGWYGRDTVELLDETGTEEEISIVVSDFDFDVLQSSTYTDIRPQVVTADGVIMMVYNDDNATRQNIDKSMLVYSIYDTAAKEWSAPVPVLDDTTADYGFAVCSSNDEIYIVWQNAKTLHNADATLTEISKNTELYVAKYDAAMGSFQHIEQVTNNEKYEFMPRIASVNGKTVVSWYVNDQDNVFGMEGNNTVEYAFKYDEDYAPKQEYVVDVSDMTNEDLETEILPSDDGEEGEPEEEYPVEWTFGVVATEDEAITSLAVGYMLDESYIAYTTDADRDTTTVNDQKIWLFDTQTDTLMSYTDKASNVEFTSVHGDSAMTWYNQGMIYYALDSESAPQKLYTEATHLGDEYHIISDENGNMAILFSVARDESSDAYVMLYDDATYEWGLPIAVTNQDKYIKNFNGAYSDGMIISIFNQVQVTDKEMDETNNLCSAVIGERHDVAISNAVFTDFELEAGGKMPLSIDVRNNGTVRISQFTITVYNKDEIVAQQTVDKLLKTGETTNVELEITLPDVLAKTTYHVEIEEQGHSDAYFADNSQELTIGRAALMVSLESSPADAENIVVVTIENKGYEASGGMIALFDEKNQVQEILLENFAPVGHGETYTCAVTLTDECFDGAPGKVFSIGVVPVEEQDMNAYNVASVYVDNVNHDNLPDIAIDSLNVVDTAESDEISLMEETTRSIVGKVKNESENDIENAKICVLTYDDRGIYLGMVYVDTVSLAAGEEMEFTAKFDSLDHVSMIKISLINNDNLEPLSSAVEIRLLDDLTDEDAGIDESEEYEAIVNEEE